MKRIVSLILILILMVSVVTMHANAALPPLGVIGDIDKNWTVDILDATELQRILVNRGPYFEHFSMYADVNTDGKVDVMDATEIQRFVAGLTCSNLIDMEVSYDMHTNDFYSDYESGLAMVGVPVTFSCSVYTGSPILGYELWVDGMMVAFDRNNPNITYTFNESGEYDVELHAVSVLKTGVFLHENFEVVEPYDTTEPVITSMYVTGTRQWGDICFDTDGYYYHANVIGGTGPYTYTFTLEIPSNFSGSDVTCYRYENIMENYIELPEVNFDSLAKDGEYNSYLECNITVKVADVNGNVTSKSEKFYYSEMRIG